MTIYQHIRNFPPEGKTGPKKGQAFLWCTLVGRKRRKKKSEHHILYWDKTNYLGENCLQNHPIQIHTSHSVIPKGHPHYRNVCCPHWKGHGMLSAAQTLNNWMTSPRKLAKQTRGKKKRGGKKSMEQKVVLFPLLPVWINELNYLEVASSELVVFSNVLLTRLWILKEEAIQSK